MNSITEDLHAMREHYDQPPLRRADLSGCPFEQFSKWLEDAVKAEIYDPNACSLATVDGEGRPVSRAVLLKALEDEQFVFYTNYQSRKSSHLDQNPNTCMHFPWFALQRQVIVTGKVEKIDANRAEEYFLSRPLESKLGAWASRQSERVDSREALEKTYLEMQDKFGDNPPKPPHWGGFALIPETIEFWQGGPSRLHDRFLYSLQHNHWTVQRLNP
ncbi:MAG: pyridoxamine 5'-phosphate oxidase [Verrucomicrobiota bacterium]|nr:pyridoxamine 5'-phosphate oxidase [Verrucomicrobiota bacterium]